MIADPLNGAESAASALEQLLSEPVADCIRRESVAFDIESAPGTDAIVLFGAGRLGRRTLQGLRRVGRTALAFADNAEQLWGSTIDGVPVLSPAEAAARFGKSATFVVTIWRAGGTHRYEQSRRQLAGLDCTHVVPMMVLGWKYPDEMLPHYCLDLPHGVLDDASSVRQAFELLSDSRSQAEFVAQLRFRLFADLDALPHPDSEQQYLASGLYSVRDDDVFVDGGAYDGDTLRSVLASRRPFLEYVALEPDAANFGELQRYVGTLPLPVRQRVKVLQIAAYSHRRRMRIDGSGSASAVLISATGPSQPDDVECVPLDEICERRRVGFLKLDIEGAEPDAILGARRVLARDRPIVAMCVYHRQNHLWQLPLLVRSLVDDYHYYLRPYNEEGWDLVCYAVPNERAMAERSLN